MLREHLLISGECFLFGDGERLLKEFTGFLIVVVTETPFDPPLEPVAAPFRLPPLRFVHPNVVHEW